MVKSEQHQKSKDKEERKSKNEQDRQLTKELEMSFPASDPPAARNRERHQRTRGSEVRSKGRHNEG